MKNLILTLLAFCFFSFSFSQERISVDEKMHMEQVKKNSVTVVAHINDKLKLEDKERAVVATVFSEYAHNIGKLEAKIEERLAADPANARVNSTAAKKMKFEKMAEFSKRRDVQIEEVLTEIQFKKYKEILEDFDPMTLEMIKDKKGKK